MNRKRAENRSKKYMTDRCRVILMHHDQDEYGHHSPTAYEQTLYDGKCFVSPGNMWPFETGSDVMRGARTDVIVYVPREVEGLNPECLIEYDNSRYEVIAFGSKVTAGATVAITARRVS